VRDGRTGCARLGMLRSRPPLHVQRYAPSPRPSESSASAGTPFYNRFFVAPLRGSDGQTVNFVGVQCEVKEAVARVLIASQQAMYPRLLGGVSGGSGAGGGGGGGGSSSSSSGSSRDAADAAPSARPVGR
jgi:hypothetical protein